MTRGPQPPVFIVATSATKLERENIEQGIHEIIIQLLRELGNQSALEEFEHKGGRAHLERELGLGSLERVELMLRLDAAFSVQLPERVVAEANSPEDLASAVARELALPVKEKNPKRDEPVEARVERSDQAAREKLLERLAEAETLAEIIAIRGRFDAETKHIYLYEENENVRAITCGELYRRALGVAANLKQRKISPGQTVGIMLPTCADFFYVFAGVMLAGAIPAPIYPPFRADRIEEYAERQGGILRNAEARLLVTFRSAESVAKLLEPQVKSLKGVVTASGLVAAADGALPPSTEMRPLSGFEHRARAEDIAFLQYTSGSTGSPRGVVLTHANLLANIRSMKEAVKIQPDDVAVSWLPLYHDMGLIGAWFVPLSTCIPLVSLSPLAFLTRPERWLRAISVHRGTLSPAPNFAYELCVRKIADSQSENLDLSCWRAALNGAEPVRPETIERFAEKFERCGFRREALLPVYGLAEATLGVAAPRMGAGARVDRISREEFQNDRRAVPIVAGNQNALEFVSAGPPLPRVEVRIVGEHGSELPERLEGHLHFRGPSATSGYYRNPEATKELITADRWLDSGDLAYLAGGEVYITGRAKDLIIKGGRNVYPQEIEEIAGSVRGVRTGCVVAFGIADAASGTERLVVAAEARDARERMRIAGQITAQVSERIGFPPDAVEIVPMHAIPKTSSGKLRRSETRRLYLEGKLGKSAAPAWMQIARLSMRGIVPRALAAAKRGVLRVAQVVYGVYALSLFGIGAAIVWVILLPTRNRRFAARLVQNATRALLFLAAIRVEITGGELLEHWRAEGPWIFAPNHSSYLDILILLAALPAEARYVAKGEIHSMPLVGLLAERSGHFAFDRNDASARVAQSAEIEEALKRGESAVIYPEGTFTPEAGVRPFQLGAFKAAVDTGRAICPVAMRGARELLRDQTILPKPGRVQMIIGPLISPITGNDGWREIVRLRDETREIIGRGAGEPLL